MTHPHLARRLWRRIGTWLGIVSVASCSVPSSPPVEPGARPARRPHPLPHLPEAWMPPSSAYSPSSGRPPNCAAMRPSGWSRPIPARSTWASRRIRCLPFRCWRSNCCPTAISGASRYFAAPARRRTPSNSPSMLSARRALWRLEAHARGASLYRDVFVRRRSAIQTTHAGLSPRSVHLRHNRRMFLTLPTLLTWARIVAIPLIVGVFYLDVISQAERNLVATVLFVVVALTDWLDGYLARKLNQTSSFGAFLDPVADKFLVCSSLLILLELGRVNAFVALVIVGVRSPFRRCVSGWPRSAPPAASPCTWWASSRPLCKWSPSPFAVRRLAVRCDSDAAGAILADPRRRRADHLVDGVLPAQGHPRNPRQGRLSKVWAHKSNLATPTCIGTFPGLAGCGPTHRMPVPSAASNAPRCFARPDAATDDGVQIPSADPPHLRQARAPEVAAGSQRHEGLPA